MTTSTISSKGQITIPKKIRQHLNLKRGSRIRFVLGKDGNVELTPASSPLSDLKGCLPRPTKPVSLKEMDEVIRKR